MNSRSQLKERADFRLASELSLAVLMVVGAGIEMWSLVYAKKRKSATVPRNVSAARRSALSAIPLGYFAYHFIRIHRTLRVTPAMAAGVADRLWDVEDLVAAWETSERRLERAA